MEEKNEYIFKQNNEVYSLHYKIISNSSAPDSDEDPNRLCIEIVSEKKVLFQNEFGLSDLINTCSIFKKFDIKEIFETIQDNCKDKSLKFENADNSMKILLNAKLNKKNLNPFIILPSITKKQTIDKGEGFNEFLEESLFIINERLNEMGLYIKKKFTNVIQFMPLLSCEQLTTNERKFSFNYSLNNSKHVDFILDSNIFYEYSCLHHNYFCIYLELKNKDLDESTKINFANFRCFEDTKNNWKMIAINKTRHFYLNKGNYEMNLVVSKQNPVKLYITDLNLCLSE